MARAPRRRSKYGNVKTTVDGMRFDSKAEAAYYAELKLREKAGEVRHIRRQVKFPLMVNGEPVTSYKADFCFDERVYGLAKGNTGYFQWVPKVVDVKGYRTPLYRLKAKWMAALGQPVTEVSRSRR